MSTKAIREALAVVATLKAPGGPMADIHAKACAEVEAIERMATFYARHATISTPPCGGRDFGDAEKTMCAIAKDAK